MTREPILPVLQADLRNVESRDGAGVTDAATVLAGNDGDLRAQRVRSASLDQDLLLRDLTDLFLQSHLSSDSSGSCECG